VGGLYNHPDVVVGKAGTTAVAYRLVQWWRWALVGVVVFSLGMTLFTRTFHVKISHNSTIESGESQAMRQHMDRDASRYAPPVAKVTVVQAPTFYPRVAPAGPPLPTLLLEESLYNRPPPTC